MVRRVRMQETRRQILEILKRRGEVTVQELSRELALTSVTVRHHLEVLRSEGYITEPEARRSNRPGRPRYVYRLTAMAADLFPSNYSGLAEALLAAMERQLSVEEREALLHTAAKRIAAEAEPLPEEPDERVQKVVAFLNQHGFTARWERVGEVGNGEVEYLIHIANCPYHYVTQGHPQVCRLDELTLAYLTGGELSRVRGYANRGEVCVYRVRIGRTTADGA